MAKTTPQKTIPQRISNRYVFIQCLSSLSISEADSSGCVAVQSFGVAVRMEDVHGTFLAAVEDGVDGELSGDVFHLATREVVGRCQGGAFRRGQ